MSNKPLLYKSLEEYNASKANVEFWSPIVNRLLKSHSLVTEDVDIQPGYNSTYPVFIAGEYVIKFFGQMKNWNTVYNQECSSHSILMTKQTILAPKIIANGKLFQNSESSWPYLIFNKVEGKSWLDLHLNADDKKNIAGEIGVQIKEIHGLRYSDKKISDIPWQSLTLVSAAQKSILPKHLIDQIDKFMTTIGQFDSCFVNGDIVSNHVFIEKGHLSAIIDWGDAHIADRHYELGKLMDTFDWDKELLKIFLESSSWPISKKFAKQALGHALYRQAVGLTQHNTFDVFYKLPELIPLDDIATLDELADVLFSLD